MDALTSRKGSSNTSNVATCAYGASRQMDPEEREKLLMENLPQVSYIARRIHGRIPGQVPLEDLINAGVVGLIEALDRFDPAQNVQLKSFAKFRIRGAILDSLRGMDWGSRDLRRQNRRIEEAIGKLRNDLGRSPSETEVAEELGIDLDEYQHLLGELRGLTLGSLQEVDAEEGGGEEVAEYRPEVLERDPFFLCLRSEMKALMAAAIGDLAEKERRVLALYYFEEMTMKEIGLILGVGESRVSQIHSAALLEMRAILREQMALRASASRHEQEKN
jgi:RNA polymerase sigma factor FliA